MIKLEYQGKKIAGEVNLPSSKSISNRLLIMSKLARDTADLQNLSEADDTKLLKGILDNLFIGDSQIIHVKNAGTVMRFLTAFLAIAPGNFILECDERMSERPISPLVDAVLSLGADIKYLSKTGFPPLEIQGKPDLQTKTLVIDSELSSQYLSALMMIAPKISGGLRFRISENQVSRPYIDMTLSLIQKCGIDIIEDEDLVTIYEGNYNIGTHIIEADWSSAAFFYELVALSSGSEIFIPTLSSRSIQGDSYLVDLFKSLGVYTDFSPKGATIRNIGEPQNNIRVDFTNYPDLALPFIAACAGLQTMGLFTGLSTLQLKESNRMEALSEELAKLGVDLRDNGFNEWVLINSCNSNRNQPLKSDCFISTHNDHRVAMSMAPLVLKSGSMTIDHEEDVSKSFPTFWNEFLNMIS